MKWSTQEFETAVNLLEKGFAFADIAEELERTPKAVKVYLNKRGYKYTDNQEVYETKPCKQCHRDFTAPKHDRRVFCSQTCSGRHTNLNRSSKKDGVNCAWCDKPLRGTTGKKYCSSACSGNARTHKAFHSPNPGAGVIRRYLLKNRSHACEICKNTIWQEGPIPLEVDHIDGNHKNNKEQNLRLICPNCHAQTPTYKSKNNGNGRSKRRERYKAGKKSW